MYPYGKVGYWKNRQGHEIQISKMSTKYINNVLSFINEGITRAYNSYYDTDFEIPQDLEDKILELESELIKRKKNKKKRT